MLTMPTIHYAKGYKIRNIGESFLKVSIHFQGKGDYRRHPSNPFADEAGKQTVSFSFFSRGFLRVSRSSKTDLDIPEILLC